MPRYFFNIRNGLRTQDFDGSVLPNLEAAKVEAEKDIAEIKDSRFHSLDRNWSNWSIEINEEKGGVLLVVPFLSN